MIQSSVFKSYDIRGIYPNQLDEVTAFAVGACFRALTGAKSIVVGYDARLSSKSLYDALMKGIIDSGSAASTIGMTSTEGLYFAVGNYHFDAGIMITASHNPKEYNGFKMLTNRDGNIEMVRGKDFLPFIDNPPISRFNDSLVVVFDIWSDYINFISKFCREIKPYKVVIDTSNGAMGPVIEKIRHKLPLEIIELNFKPDGNFPNHSPNPLEKGSADQISNNIKKQGADFGIMFDGDGDRIFLVDENGQLVLADIVLLFLAKYFLQKNPGSAIAYNAICSKAVPEFIKKWGGKPIRTQVGFVNVREGLIKNNGIMGGELSGHYCFKDYWYMDSGMIAFLTLLQIISQDSRKVSEIAKELSIYFKSAEINFEIKDKEAVLEKIKKKYNDGKQDFLDGVTVEYNDWWFNVRPSNTEPLLRLTIEADTQDLLEEKKKELTGFLAGV